jgi:hypothetical protein
MKRSIRVATVAAAALAMWATPANAGLPNDDTDPDHYTDVTLAYAYHPCADSVCDFGAEAQSYALTLDTSQGPVVNSCPSAAIEYRIHYSWWAIHDLDMLSAERGPQCQVGYWPREHALCAYSPSGEFQEDTEFWIRGDYASSNPAFGAAFGQVGGPTWSWNGTRGINGQTFNFDDEVIGEDLAPMLYSMTIDGVVDLDDELFLRAGTVGGTCSVFPELDS